jgi:hypothetical protein
MDGQIIPASISIVRIQTASVHSTEPALNRESKDDQAQAIMERVMQRRIAIAASLFGVLLFAYIVTREDGRSSSSRPHATSQVAFFTTQRHHVDANRKFQLLLDIFMSFRTMLLERAGN